MRLLKFLSLLTCQVAIILVAFSTVSAQQGQDEGRTIQRKVAPVYPDLARTRNISGKVKIRAKVLPNGTVKSADIVGGNPVLAQAAVPAVRQWKWVTASSETTETVEITFSPQE